MAVGREPLIDSGLNGHTRDSDDGVGGDDDDDGDDDAERK